MNRKASYSVEELAAEIRHVLDERGDTIEAIWALGPLMQRLAREGGDLQQVGQPRLASSGLKGRLLYQDPGGRFALALAPFPPQFATPVHSHEGWGIICLLEGSERYTTWRLLEARPGPSGKLALVQDHHLEPGDLAYWFNDPYNVHRQWSGNHGCLEIVLMAGSGRRLHHFDLERGIATPAPELRR